MTEITKTNERDERKQVSDALSSIETDISTLQGEMTTAQGDITTLQGDVSGLDGRITALEGGVDGTPPTTLKGRIVANASLLTGLQLTDEFLSATVSTSTYDVWTTLLEEAADSGVIHALTVRQTANASDRDAQCRLTIDGTVVYTSDTNLWQVAADNDDGVILVGSMSESSGEISPAALPFNTSFKLEVKKTENAAGTVSFAAAYAYHLTS